MKKTDRCIVVVLVALFSVMICGGAYADDVASGRDIAAKWGDAVVKVYLVLKQTMSYGGESADREGKSETVGTVVDPSGLTLISLDSIEAESSFGGMQDEKFTSTTTVTDVKIRFADGKEIPGKVVLRDRDLDLAFVRPDQKLPAPVCCVDLKSSAKVDLLDPVVVLGRHGKVGSRVLTATLGRVDSVIDKPRRCYTVSAGGDCGIPAFAMDGKIAGIQLYKKVPGQGEYDWDNSLLVIIPAEDIVGVAAQAPQDAPKEITVTPPAQEPAASEK